MTLGVLWLSPLLFAAPREALAPGETNTAAVVARMQAWESRFETVRFAYTSTEKPGTRFELQTLPGAEGLTAGGIPIWSYRNGVSTNVLTPGPPKRLLVFYGSAMAATVLSSVAGFRTVLFSLGVYGDGALKLSELLSMDPKRSITREGRSGLVARFSSPNDHALAYFVRWRDDREAPAETGISRPGVKVIRHYSWSPGGVWPLHVRETVRHASSEVKSSVEVFTPRPLATATPLLTPQSGDHVLDENFTIEHVQGDDGALDEVRSDAALKAAIDSRPQVIKTKPGLLCGPECLYYFARLVGKPTYEADIRGCLPEAPVRGASFFEMIQAAAKLGLNIEGYALTVDQLVRMNKPAILATRPSHFVVLVPGSHPATILDPPYSVSIIDPKDLPILWTGQALMEKQ